VGRAGVRGPVPSTDVFAPDMVWRIEGHSVASKEYGSKQQFIDEVLAPFGARFTVSEPLAGRGRKV
jgi:ketosteroid isomerase-like protein